MQRRKAVFCVENIKLFKTQMLNWADRFSICCFMDSNYYEDKYHSYDCLLAIDTVKIFSPQKNILEQLDAFYYSCNDWIFGHLSYDLKNDIQNIDPVEKNKIGIPNVFLFQPETVITINTNNIEIGCLLNEPEAVFENIRQVEFNANPSAKPNKKIMATLNKDEYVKKIKALQKHILRGDCYEINFCQEFFIDDLNIYAVDVFNDLLKISPSPFSCYYKLNDKYLLCASPERFLSKYNQQIFSQPIKGTAARSENEINDESQKKFLMNSAKEKSENVMIVDLVRNDLSKICKEGSVTVDELFGIYSFPQVHQMISTISGELTDDISFSEIIKATFPMGSMTGAPKHRVIQLIDEYEISKRGLFSGSVGYITPEKNFDFNVVIRSIFYNSTNQYLNYFVGSGITIYADAETEYEECRLKATAIEQVLNN